MIYNYCRDPTDEMQETTDEKIAQDNKTNNKPEAESSIIYARNENVSIIQIFVAMILNGIFFVQKTSCLFRTCQNEFLAILCFIFGNHSEV